MPTERNTPTPPIRLDTRPIRPFALRRRDMHPRESRGDVDRRAVEKLTLLEIVMHAGSIGADAERRRRRREDHDSGARIKRRDDWVRVVRLILARVLARFDIWSRSGNAEGWREGWNAGTPAGIRRQCCDDWAVKVVLGLDEVMDVTFVDIRSGVFSGCDGDSRPIQAHESGIGKRDKSAGRPVASGTRDTAEVEGGGS